MMADAATLDRTARRVSGAAAARASLGTARRRAGRHARETLALGRMVGPRGRPVVGYLPASSAQGSSLLRVYAVAADNRAAGWSGLVIHPSLSQAQRARLLGRLRPDLVILQSTRHPLNRRVLMPPVPYILDIDDADFHDDRHAAPPADLAAGAAGVVAGSRYNAAWAREHDRNVTIVWTGATPSPEGSDWPRHGDGAPIVCWAQSTPLGYPAELAFVAEVVERLVDRHLPGVTFRMHDMEPAAAAQLPEILRDPRVTLQLVPRLPYARSVASLGEVAVGLCPLRHDSAFSRGKSFGKVLAYLDAGVPVICNDMADHALSFTPATGVLAETPEAFAAEAARLLGDPGRRQGMADAARAEFRARLTTRRAAAHVRDFALRVVPSLDLAAA